MKTTYSHPLTVRSFMNLLANFIRLGLTSGMFSRSHPSLFGLTASRGRLTIPNNDLVRQAPSSSVFSFEAVCTCLQMISWMT